MRTITRDAAGRIEAIADSMIPALDQRFTYDALDRLTGYPGYPGGQSFAYDANGNRVAHAVGGRVYAQTIESTSNRITETEGPLAGRFTYDPAGNTTSAPDYRADYEPGGRLSRLTGATSRSSISPTCSASASTSSAPRVSPQAAASSTSTTKPGA